MFPLKNLARKWIAMGLTHFTSCYVLINQIMQNSFCIYVKSSAQDTVILFHNDFTLPVSSPYHILAY